MRIGPLFALLTLAACGGGGEENFGEDFEEKFCEEWDACSDDDCPTGSGTGGPPDTESDDCEFDQDAADDCLDGEWSCEEIEGFAFVVMPPECCAVCGDDPCPQL